MGAVLLRKQEPRAKQNNAFMAFGTPGLLLSQEHYVASAEGSAGVRYVPVGMKRDPGSSPG